MKGREWFLILLLGWPAAAKGQEMAVPVEIQYPLFLKILLFDRNLEARAGEEITLGIAYQSHYRPSLKAKEALVKAIEASLPHTLKQLPLHYLLIDLKKEVGLDTLIDRRRIDLLYLAPLRAFDLKPLLRLTRQQQITTLTGVPEYCQAGVAVGLDIQGDRPQILINLPAARAEGADFSARLLYLAKIIR